MSIVHTTTNKIKNAYLKQEWRAKKHRFCFLLQNFGELEVNITVGRELATPKDASLPLLTDAFN